MDYQSLKQKFIDYANANGVRNPEFVAFSPQDNGLLHVDILSDSEIYLIGTDRGCETVRLQFRSDNELIQKLFRHLYQAEPLLDNLHKNLVKDKFWEKYFPHAEDESNG